MKKFVLAMLLFSILIANFNFISFCNDMSTYENLSLLNDEFIIRLKNAGATDSDIKAYLDEIDSIVDSFQTGIYKQDIDEYFITIMLQVMMNHNVVLVAFMMEYDSEIVYMTETRQVPPNMHSVRDRVFYDKIIIDVDYSYEDDYFIPSEQEPEDEEISEEPPIPPKPEIPLPFDDIKTHEWAIESIVYLFDAGVVNGTGEKTFEPDKPITREEFIKMIVEALLTTNIEYMDEFGLRAKDKWYHSYFAAAEFYALIQGIFDEDEFKDEVNITRQDMSTIAYRAALRADIHLPDEKYSTDFVDMNSFSYYSRNSIKELQEADIIHGTGNNMFEPFATTTRAEAAKIVHKLMLLRR